MKIISKIASGIVVASLLTYYASPVIAYVNEETIYSNLDSNGKAYKSTVTSIVEDKNGNKTEQNETDKALPIETKITYYLDGKEMKTSEIAGKSGRVTIKMKFENKDRHGDVYTPFVVVGGLMINNKTNSNIEIVNGKLLTNGNNTIAVGIALPGMQESLGIERIDLPTSIEISMDTEKFESGNIMIYASPKLLGELDIKAEDFDELFSQINALETASKTLENGATTLTEGIKTLDEGAVQLSSGAKDLNNGVNSLKEGANTLSNGVQLLDSQYGELDAGISSLNEGAEALYAGSSAIDSGAGALVSGIGQVSDGANSLSDGISQVSSGASSLSEGISQVNDGAAGLVVGIGTVDGGINNLISGIEENVDVSSIDAQKQALQEQIDTYNASLNAIPSDEVLEAGLESEIFNVEQVTNYKQTRALLGGLVQSLEANKASLEATEKLYGGLLQIKAGIEKEDGLLAGANALAVGIDQVNSGANNLVAGINQVDEGANNLVAGINQVSDGANSLKDGTEGLVSGVNDLSNGTINLKEGSNKVVNGLSQLSNGSVDLKNGVNTLLDGTNTLYNGTVTLTEGTKQLSEGSETLSNGIKQFNQEGIGKISELARTGRNLIRKIEKLEELSKDYTNFATREERDDLKFISITDSIKVETKLEKKKENK